MDNLDELYAIVGDRPALGLSGHTHTIEQIMPGEHFHGWQENTGTGPAQFHQIVTGAVSGSWWAGDLDDAGIPHATQRLGSPRYRAGSVASASRRALWAFISFHAWGRVCGASQCSRVAS